MSLLEYLAKWDDFICRRAASLCRTHDVSLIQEDLEQDARERLTREYKKGTLRRYDDPQVAVIIRNVMIDSVRVWKGEALGSAADVEQLPA